MVNSYVGRTMRMIVVSGQCRNRMSRRAGLASLDYVLLLGVILPMVGFILVFAPKLMQLVYEMVCTLVSWPFM